MERFVNLSDLIVQPGQLGPDGHPIFGGHQPPEGFVRFGELPEHWEGFEEDTDVPCGCGG